MAQSRLQKFASIFTRIEGFIKSGAIEESDKPIWFDVFKRFPPKVDPVYLRPLPEVDLKPIFYHEDKIRAEFYRVFGSPEVTNLMDPSKIPVSELFIEKYIELAKSTSDNVDDVTLFNLAANRMREAGYRLRKYQIPIADSASASQPDRSSSPSSLEPEINSNSPSSNVSGI